MEQQRNNIFNKFSGFLTCGVLILGLLFYSAAYAQQVEDSQDEIIQKALVRAISIYDAKIGKNSMVYAGSSYYGPYNGIKGHQFFNDDYWEQGSLIYEEHAFDDIFLKYDIYRDLLLIEFFNSNGHLSPIQLYSPKVSSFELMGYYFIWIDKDTISNLKAGFYNQMYKSKEIEVLVKRRKEIVKLSEINNVSEKFSIKDRYYIRKNKIYYKVRKKSSILKTLADRKKEIKSFIKKNNFRFKYEPDKQLVEVVEYYDSLL